MDTDRHPPEDRDDVPDPPQIVEVVAPATQRELRAEIERITATPLGREDELVVLALSHKNAAIAGNAVRELGVRKAFRGDERFRRLLADERPRVRNEALRALGASGDVDAKDLSKINFADQLSRDSRS